MDMENLSSSGKRLLIFAGQLAVLFFCIWYIQFIYYTNIYPDKLVKETYVATDCTVQSKTLSQKGKVLKSYRADFLISYSAAGAAYKVWVSANGLDRSFTSDRSAEEDLLGQFDVGSAYTCWYNPETPGIVVIVLRHNWASTFPLFIPSLIAFSMIYYLGKAIFEFLGEASLKAREKRKTKK